MNIPQRVDKTPKGKIVKRAEVGEPGYGENIEYEVIFSIGQGCVEVSYYGEDDTVLSDEEILYIASNPTRF